MQLSGGCESYVIFGLVRSEVLWMKLGADDVG